MHPQTTGLIFCILGLLALALSLAILLAGNSRTSGQEQLDKLLQEYTRQNQEALTACRDMVNAFCENRAWEDAEGWDEEEEDEDWDEWD